MNRKVGVLLALWLSWAVVGNAQRAMVIHSSTPEAAGFSAAGLQVLDTALQDWVHHGWMNGAVSLVIKNGKIAYYKAVGYNDPAAKTPMQKDGIFRIASQTKAITSVAIMQLWEQGKLLLTDPVSKFIPSFKNQRVLDHLNWDDTTYTTVPANREITIRDLLTHTSGIGYAQIGSREANAIYGKAGLIAGVGPANETLLSAMTRLGTLPLLHQPGAKWTYGLNDDLLGCIIEVITGKTLNRYFQDHIFAPLGMKDTYFTIPQAKAKRLVNIYKETPDGFLVPANDSLLNSAGGADYPLEPTSYFSGGAGLSSTIYDYAIFLQMLLNGGTYNGRHILGPAAVRLMTMNQIGDLPFRPDDRFGLGFQLVGDKNGNVPSHPGTFSWGGAYTTSYWVDPTEKMVFLFYRQLQKTTHGDLSERFRNILYAAIKP